MKKTPCLLACLLLFLLPASAQEKGEKEKWLKMDFGKKQEIRYALHGGYYDVYGEGRQKLKNVSALPEGENGLRTTDLPFLRSAVSRISDAFGRGKLYIVERGNDTLRVQQLFYVYPGKPFFLAQIRKFSAHAASRYLSPISGTVTDMEFGDDPRGLVVPFDNDMWVRYDARPLNGSYTSSEVTALYSNASRKGMIVGSVEHMTWKSAARVEKGPDGAWSLTAFGGYADSIMTHDRNPHGLVSDNDTTSTSPRFMIGFYADWRDGMEAYAVANKLAEPPVIPTWEQATPMGWNSWGAIQAKISLDKAKKVVDYFADSCRDFRNADNTLFIDIDSFWDNMTRGMTGDFSRLSEFSSYCKQRGLKPGIYWAPFADWGKSPRNIEGAPSHRYEDTWLLAKGLPQDIDGARAMDPTHPGTRGRIAYLLNRFKECGFEMIKVDFLGHGAMEADKYYDPSVTTGMQAFRSGMEFVDSVLNGSMLLYAAISPNMATARYVQMRRIGCDAFSSIEHSEYTLNSTGYGWWQSHLYDYIDADHVVFGNEKPAARRARMASAVVTGTIVTGDDFSETGAWSDAAKELLQNKALLGLVKDGKSFRPLEAATGNKGVELFEKKHNGQIYLAVFNFGKEAREFTVDPIRLGLKRNARYRLTELFSGNRSLVPEPGFKLRLEGEDAAIYQVIMQN